MAWFDKLVTFEKDGNKDEKPEQGLTPAQNNPLPSSATPFPRLMIPVLTPETAQQQPAQTPVATSTPAEFTPVEETDPHLEKVVSLVKKRVYSLAGTSYTTFNAVRDRMVAKLQPGQQLDLSLVCAAIDASGKELAAEVAVMEQGLSTAEMEVGNEIDAAERDAISGLESEIETLGGTVTNRQENIQQLEQQLQALRGEQLADQRVLGQKQGEVRQQKATFTASRQRLRTARLRVAQDLSAQKRTFVGL